MSAENTLAVSPPPSEGKSVNAPYRVLARKYRPQNFEELIGQDALVRTLKNAIESGRVAHAFMLTGVRGVGKTTTARIIAKALNYTGADGTAGPTIGKTDDCALCRAISEDRHPDVIEMDAASHTGVDDMRDILDGVRYAPSEARYKIYIIDEVHMLSKNAFNALLKTLEEPPPHVKFIFATTEIRKVPITVLSRCQRFDLRRVDVPTLITHFGDVCAREGVSIADDAKAMIARAADGSVRDGLSLLDRAIALSGGGKIDGQQIKDMLGLADRARSMDLLENALRGDIAAALAVMDDLYRSGADAVVLIQDLLALSHVLTRLKAVPGTQDIKDAMAEDEMARAAGMSAKLSMPSIARTWQILLKGLAEVQAAPDPQSAAEMVIIRLVYASGLPDPAELIKKLDGGGGSSSGQGSGGNSGGNGNNGGNAPRARLVAGGGASTGFQDYSGTSGANQQPRMSVVQGGGGRVAAEVARMAPAHAPMPMPAGDIPPMDEADLMRGAPAGWHERDDDAYDRYGDHENAALPETVSATHPQQQQQQPLAVNCLEDIISALENAGDFLLASQVYQYAHLVRLQEGRLEIRPDALAPPKLVQDLGTRLSLATGNRWIISVSTAEGAPTLAQLAQMRKEQEFADVMALPVVRDVLSVFPEAELVAIQSDRHFSTAETKDEHHD